MASKGAFTFENCDKAKWDAIFGEWTPEKFREAKEALAAKKDEAAGSEDSHGPAIHGDDAGRKMFGGFDAQLGAYIDPHRARAHRREVMREKGLVECG